MSFFVVPSFVVSFFFRSRRLHRLLGGLGSGCCLCGSLSGGECRRSRHGKDRNQRQRKQSCLVSDPFDDAHDDLLSLVLITRNPRVRRQDIES